MINDNHQLQTKKYTNIKEFYQLYLSKHQHTLNRVLHFIGTGLMGLCFITAMLFHNVIFFALMPILGFGLGWVGHYAFEKNHPFRIKYFFFVVACDFIFFGDLIMGRQSFKAK